MKYLGKYEQGVHRLRVHALIFLLHLLFLHFLPCQLLLILLLNFYSYSPFRIWETEEEINTSISSRQINAAHTFFHRNCFSRFFTMNHSYTDFSPKIFSPNLKIKNIFYSNFTLIRKFDFLKNSKIKNF